MGKGKKLNSFEFSFVFFNISLSVIILTSLPFINQFLKMGDPEILIGDGISMVSFQNFIIRNFVFCSFIGISNILISAGIILSKYFSFSLDRKASSMIIPFLLLIIIILIFIIFIDIIQGEVSSTSNLRNYKF